MADKYTLRDDTLGEESPPLASAPKAHSRRQRDRWPAIVRSNARASVRTLKAERVRPATTSRRHGGVVSAASRDSVHRPAHHRAVRQSRHRRSCLPGPDFPAWLSPGRHQRPDVRRHPEASLQRRQAWRGVQAGRRRLKALAWAAASAWASARRWGHFWRLRPLLPFPDWASLSPGRLLEPSLVQAQEGRPAPC